MRKLTAAVHTRSLRCYYITDPDEATKLAKHLVDGELKGLDIETSANGEQSSKRAPQPGLDPRLSTIRLVQVYSPSKDLVVVFDLNSTGKEAITPVLSEPFVAHNALFEIKMFRYHFSRVMNVKCSMLLYSLHNQAHTFETKPIGLDAAVADRLKFHISKKEQTSDWSVELSNSQIMYAAIDAYCCYAVYDSLKDSVVHNDHYKLLTAMQHVVSDMELNGVGFNKKAHASLIKEWSTEHEQSETECRSIFSRYGHRFFGGEGDSDTGDRTTGGLSGSTCSTAESRGDYSLRSTIFLEKYFRGICSEKTIKAWPTTEKTGRLCLDRPTLTKIRNRKGFPKDCIEAYLATKKAEKRISTYGESLAEAIHCITGRIHPSYRLGYTRSGRLSSQNPNIQNIPRDSNVREVFTPNIGNCFVAADFSQVELRVASELSNDVVMKTAFRKSIDLHSSIVSSLFGKPVSKVTKSERQLGKAINFGLAFGMGPTALREYALINYGHELSEVQAKQAYDLYRRTYKGYYKWCEKQRQTWAETGRVSTVLGKIRCLSEEHQYTQSANTPVQGGAAEVLMMSMVILRKKLAGKGSIILTVHDEILIETKPEYAEEIKQILEDSMKAGFTFLFPTASTRDLVEASIGLSWGEVH